ncbi:MAG TPA: biopolymer transporter ExbD [Gemmatimonadaceae bacterium]|nr:biopolymer transporter ExbD [Gemmatimonadaceae bacterium]
MAISANSGGGVQSTPNVTPMIDVMLVLLIIFMVVTPALLAGFNATPPQAVNLKDHPEDANLDQVLGIDRDGKYYLNKRPIDYKALGPMIKQIYDARTEDKIMYLKADKGLDYSKVLDALDIAGKNGVRVTGLISDQRPGTHSAIEGDVKVATPPAAAGGKPSGGKP